ncbi:MAG: hypothetical protein R3E36_12165 [Nitrosomonas sp.]|nr:hypothetical protein [Burkholderiales bacterium]MCP5292804.1 hypothetical protein [Burkholderiales bacterium]MDR4521326.1 hypothetical protein [Nitrosomonas sp.]HQU63189.1 hypothetical protein [Nitrosomonas sp.]
MDNWWILLVEAAVALGLFLFIIWWTMFSGKKKDNTASRTESKDTNKTED